MLSVFPHPNLKSTYYYTLCCQFFLTQILKVICTARYAVSFSRTSNSLKSKNIFMLHVMLSVLLALYQEMELFGRFVTESEFPEMLLPMKEVCQIGSNIPNAAPI